MRIAFLNICMLGVLALVPRAITAKAAEEPKSGVAFFESKIRPILVNHCYSCHSAESKKTKGGLRLDTRQATLKGGDSGPAVVPGKLHDSLLLQAVAYDGTFYDMPPDRKLSDMQIADLKRWVEIGAPDPRAESAPAPVASASQEPAKSAKNHWAFQPTKKTEPPQVNDKAWPIHEIDRFILARLEQQNLAPAPPANRQQWLRRVWFDLVGLPPTTEAIQKFLADMSPELQAKTKVVDELLAMPQFGERWGRHWLDVARFAESSGGGRSLLFKDAWRYRDYVINAFNADMPYDQFLKEQIAGDLLPAKTPADRARLLTATGFLVLGPTNYEEQEKYQLRMDIVDEQLDTLGRTTMGMTLGCARCHDHKFDPIPTRDYYALAGIFRSTRTLFNDTDNVARWIDTPLPADPETAQGLHKHQLAVSEKQTCIKAAREELLRLDPKTAQLAKDGSVNPADLPGIALDDTQAKAVGGWKPSTFGGRYLGSGAVYDERRKGTASTLTFDPEIQKSGLYEVRLAYVPHTNRATNTAVTILHAAGEELKRINQKETPPIEGRFLSLGTFRFEAGGAGFVMVSNEGANGAVSVDGVWFMPVDSGGTSAKTAEGEPADKRLADARKALKKLEKELADLRKSAPPQPVAMAVHDHEKIEESPIHIRGNSKTLGSRVPRGALSVVQAVPIAKIPDNASGRLQLADWLTDPRHPLTSRVMANRLWLWLFGQGLVPSQDNFGTTGDRPTHPELLDWLAGRFVREGWSVKHLIREIVLTQTYGMSSDVTEKAHQADPENRLWSHALRRRQDADALRDAMLAAAGVMDLRLGGPNIDGATAIDANDNGAAAVEYGYQFKDMRRSVYTPAFRNNRLELFESFDFADINQPIGRREQSTVATQALFMMNHPFVRQISAQTARRALAAGQLNDAARLDQISLWILSRPATDAERAALLPAVAAARSPAEAEKAWARVAHALFASVEFRYVQ